MHSVRQTANETIPKHVAIFTGDFKGHLRASISLAPMLLHHAEDLTVALVVHTSTLQHVKDVLATYELTPGEVARLTVIGLGSEQPNFGANGPAVCYQEMVAAVQGEQWDRLFNGKGDLPSPRAVVCDYFLSQIATRAFETDHPAVRFLTLGFIPGAIWQLIQFRALGDDPKEWHEICSAPGHPDLYAYEQLPCSLPWPPEYPARMERTPNESILAARHNALFLCSREILPHTHDGLQQVMAKGGKRCIDLGANYPSSFWQTGQSFNEKDNLCAFLDAKFDSHGEQSVIYVSFGTIFWPGATSPELAEAIVQSLIASGSPFVLIMAGIFVTMLPDRGESVKRTVTQSGNFVTDWCDQPKTFHHPAVGWLLTHGGFNGLFEALACGLPMIIYPMGAEQVGNAAALVAVLDVAFEILQGRDLLKGKKLHNYPDVEIVASAKALRAEMDVVLGQLWGPRGQQKRVNAQKIGASLRDEHATKQPGYVREFVDLLG